MTTTRPAIAARPLPSPKAPLTVIDLAVSQLLEWALRWAIDE
jgi:hypothetical protein